MGNKLSGAAKRKKKKEKEDAIAETVADLERLKLGPTALWTGLVLHHRDIFVSHVLSKLNETDRFFFSNANAKHMDLLEYAGINKSERKWNVYQCSSISTLEWAWNKMNLGGKLDDGTVKDQAWFCSQVARTNKLELLKWAREEKKCEWGEWTINNAAAVGNLEILKYCFANSCPCDEQQSFFSAVGRGHLDCLRFLFDEVKPSRETEQGVAIVAVQLRQLDIMKYVVEERKVSDDTKIICVSFSALGGHLDCLRYLVQEAKIPLDDWRLIAYARFFEHTECLHYLREKGCPEPTDAEYTAQADILTSIVELE
jgi:hypothetical protein